MSTDIDKKLGYSQIIASSYREPQNINNLKASSHFQPNGQFGDPSPSKMTAHEILKPSRGSSPFQNHNPSIQNHNPSIQNQLPFQNKPSNLQAQPTKPDANFTYSVWGDMVKDQAQIARKELENQKIEERLRKQRYRDHLGKLAQEQKQQRLFEHAEHLNSYPNRDWEACKEFDNAYKQNQQMHKQQIRDSLDENFRAYVDKQYQMRQEKEMTDAQMLKKFEEARKYDQMSKSMERERKNVLMSDLKSDFQRYSEHLMEQDQKRQALDREFNQQETNLRLNQEKQGKQFYDKIRAQSLERNMRGLEHLQPFVKEAHQRSQHIDQLIEQSRLDRIRFQAEEQNTRHERQKQLYLLSQNGNEQIMKLKMTEDQIKRQEADLKFEEMRKRMEETKKLETMKKMSEQDNKKQYQHILNHQVHERIQTRRHENDLNRIEQQLMARKDPESAFIAVPNGKYSHERQLQLKYIDNWLLRNPSLPPEEHQRLKYRKDPFESGRGYSHYNSAGTTNLNLINKRNSPIL